MPARKLIVAKLPTLLTNLYNTILSTKDSITDSSNEHITATVHGRSVTVRRSYSFEDHERSLTLIVDGIKVWATNWQFLGEEEAQLTNKFFTYARDYHWDINNSRKGDIQKWLYDYFEPNKKG